MIDINTPNYPFVDDTLVVDTKENILRAMAASIEALFLIMGFPDIEKRPNPISLDKFYQAECSFIKKQLGANINTRTMRVLIPADKIIKLNTLLSTTWHDKRQRFSVMESAILLGNLEHFSQTCPWARGFFRAVKMYDK